MATTNTLECSKDNWTEVPLDGPFCIVQLNEKGAVKVRMSDDPPAPSDEAGIFLQRATTGVPGAVTFGNIPDGVGVYVRSALDPTEIITFLTY